MMSAAATSSPTDRASALGPMGSRIFLEATMTKRELRSSATRGLNQLASRFCTPTRADGSSNAVLRGWSVVIYVTVAAEITTAVAFAEE